MLKQPRTRNRTPRPSWTWSGSTTATWQLDESRVAWAQQDPLFREIVTILTNERTRITSSLDRGTENRRLGMLEGYQLALDVLHELTTLPTKQPSPNELPTYPVDSSAPSRDYLD